MEENILKVCCICKESKPLTEFYNLKKSKDGKAANCKACQIKMNAASKAKTISEKKETKPVFEEYRKAWMESKALPGFAMDRTLASRMHRIVKKVLELGKQRRSLEIYMAAHNKNLQELDGLFYMQWIVNESRLIVATHSKWATPEDHAELKACLAEWQRQYMNAQRSMHCRAQA